MRVVRGLHPFSRWAPSRALLFAFVVTLIVWAPLPSSWLKDVAGLVPLSAQGGQAPGGFMVPWNSTASRGQLTAAQIAGFVPGTRGAFNFPAPYNTKAWRVTDTTDCAGDCQNFGYSLWTRINNSAGQNLIRVVVPQSKGSGGGGPTLFTINKTTDAVVRVGAIFSSGAVESNMAGEQLMWSKTDPARLWVPNGPDPFISPWPRLDLCDVSGTLPINPATSCVTKVNMASAGAIAAFGSGREIFMYGVSRDDNIIGFIVQNGGTSEGCGVRNVSANTYTYFDALRGSGDDVQGCFPTGNGLYLIMSDVTSGGAQINRTIRLSDRSEVTCTNGSGATNCDAASHLDVGHSGYVMFDGWQSGASIKYYNATASPSGPRTIAWQDPSFSYISCNTVSWANSDGTAGNDHAACSEVSATNGPRGNEIQLFRVVSGAGSTVLIAGQWMGSSTGYPQSPFVQMSPDGQYLLWSSNLKGARMHTFVLWVPTQLMYGGTGDTTPPTASMTAPGNGATVSGSVTLSANATDNVGVLGVQFLLDGANLGSELFASPYSIDWNSVTVPNGNHTLAARARDAAGNVTTSTAVTVNVQNTVDQTPPTVSLTAPASGATVSGTTNVTANASDNIGVVGVQFLLDGVNLGAEDTTSPYSASWNTVVTLNGTHVLSARARDASGNTTTSASRTVTVSNTVQPPTGLVAAYGYNENSGTLAADASPTGNGAVLSSAAWAAGQFGSSFFPNATAYAESADVPALTPGAAATFGAWVYLTSAPVELASIVNKWSQSAEDEYLFGLTASRNPYFAWRTAGGVTWGTPSFNDTVDPSQVPLNTWTHVALVRNGATLTFYVNGVPTSSVSAMDGNPFHNGTNSLRVGGQSRGGMVRAFPGRIDELRIYASALTDPQIQADINTPIGTAGDTTPPTSSVTAPAGGATVSGTVTVTATASDNVGVLGVQFRIDGVNLSNEDTTSPYSISWNTATATNGNHALTAVARDAAGNTTTSAAVTVTVQNTVPDNTPPAVSLTAPANGATVTGTVTVSANASDNVGVAGVQFLLDGVNLGAEDTSSPYSVSWNAAASAIGTHTLAARARDAAGNTTTSATITVVVPDTTAPIVSISTPASGATVTGTITVSAVASDNVGVVGVQFLLDGGNLGAEDTVSPYAVSWNTATATIGTHTLTARARDAAGNTTTSATITVTVVDTTAPTVSVSAPANGATVTGTVTVSAAASDNVGVVGVQFLLDGANLGAEDTTSPYSVSWNTATATIGTHTLTAVARDAAGNTTTSATISITIPDTTAPTVSLMAPANGATVSGVVSVTASAADNVSVSGVQFLLNGINLGAEDRVSPFSVSWDTAAAAIGTHTLAAVARDAAGNTTTSATITVTVPDTTVPAVSITAPANGATVSGVISVNATASDNVGVAGVQFLLDGVDLGAEDTSSPYSVSWNTATAATGSHTLTARARDAAGNTTTSTTITVTVPDTSGPTVSVTAPANGATVTGTVTVSASASDNVGVVGVQFLLDGANLGAEDTASPYSVSWNTATAIIGTHTLTARARDAAGNTTTSATITVTVPDTTVPAVSIAAPANGATVTGTVTVSAIASDNVGVVGVQFLLDGVNLGAEDTTSPYSVSWNTTAATIGTHSLTARARDAAGNTTTSATITVTVPDTSGPTVSITAPANGATVTGMVTVSANASDNVGVAGVQFLLDGATLGAEDTSSPYSVSWNTATATIGTHTLAAVARDAAGNTTTSATITVTVPDTTVPAVSITAPANGATVTGTVAVTATASDNVGVAGVQFLLDGVNLGAEDTTSPYSVSWNTATAAAGSHTLTARARDAAGNTTTSAAVAVTVPDTSGPTISITAPANGATVSGVIPVTATASDNVGVVGVQFLVDGANLGAEDTSSPYSVSWSTTTVSNGSHTLTAVARDAAGNTTTSTAVIVTVQNADTTPPAVSLTAPASGATVSGTAAVTATASDNVGVAGVQFLLDGVNLGAEDTTSPYSISWDSTTAPNGSHTLTALARDAAGNTTTSTAVVVTVQNTDATAPAVSLTAPANGATVTGVVSVTASASDNVGVAGVQFLLDGANLAAEDTTSPYSVSWNTATATIGTHTLAAVARDAAGNTTTSATITITVPDTSGPAVSITAPANGATVTGMVTITATASDNVGVAGVQFLLDGVDLSPEDTSSPFSVSWDTASAVPGTHTLTAVARDAAGNTTTSATITVTVPDTSEPTISLTAPANGATVSGVVSVTASAADNVGVMGVQFLLDGVNLGAEDTSSPHSVSWNTATAAIGTHTLAAVARDAAGNTTTSETITVTVPDTSGPTITLTEPANAATVTGTVTVSANASDNVGVAGVQFLLDGVNLGAEDTSNPYSVSWNTTTAAIGTHTLAAVARDAAGNTTTSATITVTVPDTTVPAVSITAPANGATVSGSVSISADASDNVAVAGVQFLLDGVNLGAEDTTSPFSVSWNTATAVPGTHNLTARARDTAGNTTTSATVTVTVSDTAGPTVSIATPANGATVTGTVLVSANASDNVGVSGVQFLLDGANLGAEDTTSTYSVSWNTATAAIGTHTLAAVARDAAGNITTSATVTVTVPDTLGPTISLTAPANGATVTSLVTISADAFDNVGVAGVQFRLDGANLGAEVTSSPYLFSWSSGGVANGSHTLSAVARDAAGNTATSATVTVTVSNATPAPGLVAAYGYNEGGGTSAFDASPTGSTATLMGATWAAGWFGSTLSTTLGGFAESADANALTPGTTATFSAWVFLASSPTEVASMVNKWDGSPEDEYLFGLTPNRNLYFSWHTTGGSTWGTPAYGEVVSTGQVPLSAWTHIAVIRSAASVSFYVNGFLSSSSSPMDANPFRNGINSFRVGGQNRGGANREFPGRIDELRVYTRVQTALEIQTDMDSPVGGPGDTTPPAVAVTSPPNGATVSGIFMLGADATDDVGVAGVRFKVDGVNVGAEDLTAPYSTTFVTLGLPNGVHTITAVARDAAGNTQTSAPVTVTVQNIALDTVPPAVSLIAPADGATVSGTVAVSATASDNVGVVGVQFKLDGANLGAEDTSSPFTTSWITATAANGVHTITAVARDAAGNTTISAARSITVSNGGIIAGLIAAYSFDEGTGRTPADSSPLGNHGTLMAGASWAPALYATALATNGTGYAEAADLQPLTPGTAATFEAWVYLTSPPGGLVSVINKWSQSVDDEYLFGLTSNRRLHFAWKTTGAAAWGTTSYNETTADAGQLPVGAWTHVAVVRTGTTLTFYINGDVAATASVMDANPFRDGRNTLRIGGQGRGTVSPYFPGLIDEVRIYNRALTQAEIQQDMNTPIGGGGLAALRRLP